MTFVYARRVPDREITVPEHIYAELAEIGASLLDLLDVLYGDGPRLRRWLGPQDLMLIGLGRSGVWLAVHLVEDEDRDEMFTVRAVRTLDGPERKAIEGTQP
jgi:hypothetical protein